DGETVRVPVRSDTDAVRAVFLVAAVVALCVALGRWVAAALGSGLALFAVSALLVWMFVDRSAKIAVRRAEAAGQGRNGPRTLLIANQAPTREEFRRPILARLGPDRDLEVHAPVLQSRTHFVPTDIHHERNRARDRL